MRSIKYLKKWEEEINLLMKVTISGIEKVLVIVYNKSTIK